MFDPAALSVLAYADGWTQWLYRASDPLAEVAAPGYFRTRDAAGHRGASHLAGRDRVEVVADGYDATLSVLGAWRHVDPPDVVETAVLSATEHWKDRAA